jgi:hypothetical protein
VVGRLCTVELALNFVAAFIDAGRTDQAHTNLAQATHIGGVHLWLDVDDAVAVLAGVGIPLYGSTVCVANNGITPRISHMATPQEVLEIAIPLPADATSESKRSAAARVIEALASNDYYFARRTLPVLDRDDGQCPTCKCELVHVVDQSPAFEDAQARHRAMTMRIEKMHKALMEIAEERTANPAQTARVALY